MRLFARGKWLKDQKRWSVLIPLPETSAGENSEDTESRKEPLRKNSPSIVRFRRRPRR
ncbi:hypothetical protein HRbin30_02925 [bacterium HR30]|nr:hypothetical protein HRbin30_02925 [bacterium HR30]